MLDKHYVAGIIDGEGHIGFFYKRETNELTVRVQVCMTDPKVPTLLCQQFSGFAYVHKPSNDKAKYATKWMIFSDDAVKFLDPIKDLLLVRGNQAYLAMNYHKFRKEMDLSTRMLFKEIMHKLNKVGRRADFIIPSSGD